MLLDYLGEKDAANAIERIIIDLFRSKRLRGAGSGDHKTDEVGDMVVSELRANANVSSR